MNKRCPKDVHKVSLPFFWGQPLTAYVQPLRLCHIPKEVLSAFQAWRNVSSSPFHGRLHGLTFWSAWWLSIFVDLIWYSVQFGGLGIVQTPCFLLSPAPYIWSGWVGHYSPGPLGVSRTIGPLYGPQQTLYSTTPLSSTSAWSEYVKNSWQSQI